MNNNIFDLDWDWNKEIIFNLDGENELLPADKLGRRRYAEYLYFYLKEKGSENNTVINLNAEWGAGKTFFVKRLYSSLKDKHPCIYIDAWKQDYSDDPFLTLFASLISQIEHYSGRIDSRLIRIGDSIGRFTKGVIPEILSGLLKNYAGMDNIGEIAKSAATLMLKEHKEKNNAIITLKKELSFWAQMSFNKGYEAPIFIFIDELDRCRPNYAISLLEIVKHIFNIDKFVFIIATDTDQLQHSIKNIYGNGFGANHYLGRFFHRRFSLKAPDFSKLIHERIENSLSEKFTTFVPKLMPKPSSVEQLAVNISEIFTAFSFNIRDSLRNTDRLIDLLVNKSFKKHIDYIALMILMIIYDKSPELTSQIMGKTLATSDIDKLILNNKDINGFGIKKLNLLLDCSSENLGVDYFYLRHPNIVTTTNKLNLEKICIPSTNYMGEFKKFITMTEEELSKLQQKKGDNRFFKFASELTNEEKVMALHGVIFEHKEKAHIYRLEDYLSFIELATSFD
ncbi:TPA: P-loop NTPase fold protein [Yersinia enterocolitica]|nr:NTPase [Yersinia enterocolitica]HDL6596079.1 NTPase [Yersinia enterocolitica]HDV0802502.1 NTPase [Yersinia enterocolitica]HDZ9579441.1 NTPase [Yersinia enterocolitica]HDZ9666779.1 NTPase [Yersinia enterocolitica]